MTQSIQTPLTVVTLDKQGDVTGSKIKNLFPNAKKHELSGKTSGNDVEFFDVASHLKEIFEAGHPIIGVFATGILIRTLAPLLSEKMVEPPVISVAGDGSVAVPLLGGHRGANFIARRIASDLGGEAAITTASDSTFGVSLDCPPAGWKIQNIDMAKMVTAKILSGTPIKLNIEASNALWLQNSSILFDENAKVEICVTDREQVSSDSYCLRPPVLAMGIGCVRDCDPSEVIDLATKTLIAAELSGLSIACVVSVDIKSNETAVHAVAEHFGVPARFFSANILERETPRLNNPSATVFKEIGCHGVAEASALAAAGPLGTLIVDKKKSVHATCAIARSQNDLVPSILGQARGKLSIVGIGPGSEKWRTAEAILTLSAATDIVGYRLYFGLVEDLVKSKNLHRFELSEEEDRARLALKLASEGKNVALISSGDAGIYAMASVVFELLDHKSHPEWARVEVVVVPGVSALQAAAAKIGAPIGNDFCTISLSDLMTPWSVIEQRIKKAAEGDFVIAFYNPASKKRKVQFAAAINIILNYRTPSTPVVLAKNLGRARESVIVKELNKISVDEIDMLTLVIVGSSNSRLIFEGERGRLFTPRGYLFD